MRPRSERFPVRGTSDALPYHRYRICVYIATVPVLMLAPSAQVPSTVSLGAPRSSLLVLPSSRGLPVIGRFAGVASVRVELEGEKWANVGIRRRQRRPRTVRGWVTRISAPLYRTCVRSHAPDPNHPTVVFSRVSDIILVAFDISHPSLVKRTARGGRFGSPNFVPSSTLGVTQVCDGVTLVCSSDGNDANSSRVNTPHDHHRKNP